LLLKARVLNGVLNFYKLTTFIAENAMRHALNFKSIHLACVLFEFEAPGVVEVV
jgi:hypothetical protein